MERTQIKSSREQRTREERMLDDYEHDQKGAGTKKRHDWWIERRRQTKIVSEGKTPHFLFLSGKDKIIFTKHLAVMLEAGIPLKEGLEAMRDQTPSKALRLVLAIAVKDLSDGQVLAHTLAKFPRLFDSFFANVVGVGEASGTLSKSLLYLAVQIEKSRELQGKLRTALIYPIIILVAAFGIAIYLAFFLLPQFVPLFNSLDINLPITTRLLLGTTAWLTQHGFWLLAGLIVAGIGLTVLWYLKPVRFVISRALLTTPIFGKLIRDVQTMQFARILGTLLSSGVKIVPALRISSQSLPNIVYEHEVARIASLVERGETIGTELALRTRLFSKTTASMVAVGEQTGRLAESLLSLAEFTEREVDATTRNFAVLIEPLVLVVVGVLVGFVALSLITPLYQLTEGLSR